MKILVTGSSGFIGSEIVKQAQTSGVFVVGIDLTPPSRSGAPDHFHNLDILNQSELMKVGIESQPDAIIHLAASHNLADITNELIGLDAYKVNVEGTRNILEMAAALSSVKRVIFTSTQLISNIGHQVRSLKECAPNTYYGRSKLLGEEMVHEFGGKHYTWTIVRPTTVWGPGMNKHFQRFLRYVRDGKYFHISKKPLYKSWSYIENIAWQYLRILELEPLMVNGKSLYLADYEPISLRDYANELQRNMKSKRIPSYPEYLCKLAAKFGDVIIKLGYRRFPFSTFRVKNILNEYVYDLKETRDICGPVPVGFQEGVKRTALWFQELSK